MSNLSMSLDRRFQIKQNGSTVSFAGLTAGEQYVLIVSKNKSSDLLERNNLLYIAQAPAGENGFGYDPIFLLKNSDKTMAELSENEKNKLSHRAKALEKVLEYINKKSICI